MDWVGLAERAYYLVHRRGAVAETLRGRLGGARRILDFGGGDGRVSAALAARMTDASFVVADVDRAALSRVPRGGRLFPVLLAPGQPLPFADGAFDAVLAVDVLHHVPEPEALAAELVRSLRPEGRLLAVEFDGRRPWARLLRRILRAEGRECRPWDPDTLRTTLGRAGFDARPEPLDSLRFLVEALTSPGPGSP